MTKEFVKYEQALALKELGFDEECFDYYNPIEHKLNIFGVINSKLDFSKAWIPAPLYQQAFRWFREKYRLSGFIFSYNNTWNWKIDLINVSSEDYSKDIKYDTYEEAESACLDVLIEICKNK